VSDEKSEITLKDLAQTLADIAGTKVIFEPPDEIESAGYSKATKALLDNGKLKSLGWESGYDIRTGLGATVKILSEAGLL
jgi:nucleoside-diphosphate-sugar epimerase